MKKRTTNLKIIFFSTLMLFSAGLMAEIDIESTQCICPNAEGSITLTVSGTAGPFRIVWEGPNGYHSNAQNPDDITMPGAYTVVVTNAYGCETILSTEVVQCNQNNPLEIQVNSMPTCYDESSGSASVEASGGESPYTYLWDDENASTESEITDLAPGMYCVTVTDAQGCEVEDCVEVQELSAINIEFEVEASCSGQNTGSIEAMVSGGVEPYTYMWSDLSNQSSMQNVASGTHWVLVHDATGCQTYAVVDVPVMESPTVTPMVSYASCEDNEDGAIELEISGGTAPYEVFWENSDYNGMTEINNLAAGDYEVTVTGSNGCSTVEVINTEASSPHRMMPFIERVTVNATNGNQTIPIYNGYWDETGGGVFCYNGGMEDISGSDLELIQNGGWALEVTAFIQGELLGDISLNVEGYIGYVRSVNQNIVSWQIESNYAQQIAANNFNVNLIFEHNDLLDLFRESNQLNGCVQIPLLQEDCSWLPAYTQGQDTHPLQRECATITFDVQYEPEEVVSAEVSGDASDYTFDWAGPEGFTATGQRRIRPEAGGEYCLTITSQSNDCVVEECVEVCSDFDDIIEEEDYVQYILPCYGQSNGSICIPSEIKGYQVTIDWDRSGNEYCLENISANDWCATITEQTCGRSVYHCFRLDELPKGLEAEVTSTVPPCRGMSDGQLCIAVTEGLPPYTYQWENGQSGNCINFVEAGTYCVTIVDDCGSVGEQCFTLESVAFMSLTDLDVIPTCEDVSEGSVSFSILGGQPPYDITMIDRTSGEEVNSGSDDVGTYLHLGEGYYIIEIEDDCGGEISETVYVPEISEEEGGITIYNLEHTKPTCGNNDGIYRVRALTDHEFLPVEYVLSSNSGEVIETGFTYNGFITIYGIEYGTSYSIVLTNAAGCSEKMFYQYGVLKDARDYFEPNDNYSCNDEGGSISSLLSDNEQEDWNYSWDNGSASSELSDLEAGTYCVTMTDVTEDACATGCWEIEYFEVDNPEITSLEINPVISYFGQVQQYGTVLMEVSGCGSECSYQWSNGTVNQNLLVFEGGDYSVTITNEYGCELNHQFSVEECVRKEGIIELENIVMHDYLVAASIDVSIEEGYGYYWLGPNDFYSNSEDISDLDFVGDYTLYVYDDCGLAAVKTFSIVSCYGLDLYVDIQDPCRSSLFTSTRAYSKIIDPLSVLPDNLSGTIRLIEDNGNGEIQTIEAHNFFNYTAGEWLPIDFLISSTYNDVLAIEVILNTGCTIGQAFELHQSETEYGEQRVHLAWTEIFDDVSEHSVLLKSGFLSDQNGNYIFPPYALGKSFNCENCDTPFYGPESCDDDYEDYYYSYRPTSDINPCTGGGTLITYDHEGEEVEKAVPADGLSMFFQAGDRCACYFQPGLINIAQYGGTIWDYPVYVEFDCNGSDSEEGPGETTIFCGEYECSICNFETFVDFCAVDVYCYDENGDLIDVYTEEHPFDECYHQASSYQCIIYSKCSLGCNPFNDPGASPVGGLILCENVPSNIPECCTSRPLTGEEGNVNRLEIPNLTENSVFNEKEEWLYAIFYPNPTKGDLEMKVSSQFANKGVVNIYNVTGNKVGNLSVDIEEGTSIYQIDVNALNPGIYFLSLTLEDGQVITHKFVKE